MITVQRLKDCLHTKTAGTLACNLIKENGIKEMQFLNEELLLWSRRLGKFLGFVVYCVRTMKGYGIIFLR